MTHEPRTSAQLSGGFLARLPQWQVDEIAAGELALRDQDALAAFVVGVDRLRVIVDALGLAAGDEVLAVVANRLEAALRQPMMLSTLVGDAFALLAPGISSREAALELAASLQAAAAEPIVIGDQELVVSISVGVALTDQLCSSAQGALRDAAAAQHRAQQLGGGRIELYDTALSEGALEALRLEGELRSAVRSGEGLSLFFQPCVSLGAGEVIEVEALLRWEHPTLGLLLPSRFLELAERTGILPAIERWVLAEACRQLASWEHPRRVSVNISAGALSDPSFAACVVEQLRLNSLRGDQLTLELSEQTALPAHSATRLEELRALGVRVLLDDVGAGPSWLTRRQRLPVDGLKLSRSIVAQLELPEIARLAELIVATARPLGLPVIAEGVETAGELERVIALGADAAQGLHFLGPVPGRTLREVLAISDYQVAAAPPPSAAGAERAVSLGQAASLLGISASTLRRWAEDGRITAVRTSGGHRRFYLSELTRLAPTRAARLRTPPLPDTALPAVAEALHADGTELTAAAARSLYSQHVGWFARDEATEPLRAWVRDLAGAFERGRYDTLADSLRRLMLCASVAAAPLAERHLFLERFGAALEARLIRLERPQREQAAARRVISALALEQLGDCADPHSQPAPPPRRRRANRRREGAHRPA